MSKPYLDMIDEQIEQHERAIAKLTIAREVVAALGTEALGGARPKGTGKPKAATMNYQKGARIAIVTQALQALGGPAPSKQIIAWLADNNEPIDAKAVYNALYQMVGTGALVRIGKSYAFPAKEVVSDAAA